MEFDTSTGKVMDVAQMQRIAQSWMVFSKLSGSLLRSEGVSAGIWSNVEKLEWANSVQTLGNQGLSHLVAGQFLDALERVFKEQYVPTFWQRFEDFPKLKSESKYSLPATAKLHDWVRATLPQSLAEICAAKSSQEECLTVLAQVFNLNVRGTGAGVAETKRRSLSTLGADLFSQYQTSVSSLLLTTAPKYFADIMNLYFKTRLEEFSTLVKKRNARGSPRLSDESDEDPEAVLGSIGHHSQEDDDMESVPSSSRTSMHVEDMEVNGSGSPYKQRTGDDDDSGHQMPYVDNISLNYFKQGVVSAMDEVVELVGEDWVTEVGGTVRHLRELGYTSMSEEGYSSAVYSLLKSKIHFIANKRYEKPVLLPVWRWLEAVPLRFLCVILAFSGSPSVAMTPSPSVATCLGSDDVLKEGLLRWRSRVQSFAFETLGDLRVSELFDIIVDFPESLAAVEDLKQCLANTGDHAKLVDSFRDALQHRLLTAGAATTDILLQYISTIKALRALDPTGVVLEAVGEPIKEYLRGRKDTIRCIVTMLTDDTGAGGSGALGGVGESLLEELSRGTNLENVDSEDDGDVDGEEAWAAAQRWEPDPVDADPTRTSKSRRLMDIIGMLVGIYGSKELFVNEYRVMLAEKLLNKSDYDTERNIRTLELLKLRFGENNMHGCEIMLKDVADSKRINANIKASTLSSDSGSVTPGALQAQTDASHSLLSLSGTSGGVSPGVEKNDQDLSVEVVNATIISALFWPPFQAETIKVPDVVDQLLDEYADRYHALRAPRKLQWRKHLGTVKLELQFEDRSTQFVVSPLHASIIMQFEDQPSWAASDLAEAVGVPVSTLRRRIMLWVNQGVLVESPGETREESEYTIVENLGDVANRNSGPAAASDTALLGEEDGESAVTSMEDQWQQEMNVYESYVVGMLTNFETLPLDRIHNMLKMFVSDPPYDKTLPQLQSFLGRLVSEDKIEFREGSYCRRPS